MTRRVDISSSHVVLAVVAALAIAIGLDVPTFIRLPVALLFLAICPGVAFVPLLNVERTVHQLTLIIATSFAANTLIVQIFLLSGSWTPNLMLFTIGLVSAFGIALQHVALGAEKPDDADPEGSDPEGFDPGEPALEPRLPRA